MRAPTFRFAAWIVPGALWLWWCWHLHDDWSLLAQYNYGWAVPFLAAFLFYLRWNARPTSNRQPRGVAFAGALLLAVLLPIRLIEEANPDWRLLSWVLALVVVACSLLALLRAGGGAWLRHLAFPVLFPLVAVPWPVLLENVIIQGLSRAVAYAAVEIAGWVGIGAYQIGNVIELHNGFVGVDEACSGVKTLQASIMVSLVLGELLRLRPAKRVMLVVAGAAWVFACNVLRAATLVIIAAKQGTGALHQWHDTIGTVVVIVGMAGLLLFAWSLARGGETASQDVEPRKRETFAHRVSWRAIALSLAWLVFVFAATELWYRAHERELVSRAAWTARWPLVNGAARELPIADTTAAILRYDYASSAAWEAPAGNIWWGFFARWEPRRAALQLVRSHSPEICLPAAGRVFRRELPQTVVTTTLMPLAFRVFEFEQNHQPLFVFVCIQEDKFAPDRDGNAPAEFSFRGRLRAVLHGERNLGQRLLELAVVGMKDDASATTALAPTVRAIVAAPAAQPTG